MYKIIFDDKLRPDHIGYEANGNAPITNVLCLNERATGRSVVKLNKLLDVLNRNSQESGSGQNSAEKAQPCGEHNTEIPKLLFDEVVSFVSNTDIGVKHYTRSAALLLEKIALLR